MLLLGEAWADVGVETAGMRDKAEGLLVNGLDGDEAWTPEILRSKISIALLGMPPLRLAPATACKPPALATIVSRSGQDK